MDQNLLPDIFAFLARHRPEWGTPRIIFMGGSQVINRGIHKTQNSDHDILILFPQIPYAESYSYISDDGQRTYDLILRDMPTLTYDVINSQNIGRGTLLHMISRGVPLYDPDHLAPILQNSISNIYNKGPHIIDWNSSQDELYTLQSNLFNIPTGAAFQASLAAICNRIASNALRFSGRWTSTGKIAGRFLKEEMPQFSTSLRNAFDEAVNTHDERFLAPFLDKHLPLMYLHFKPAGKEFSPPQFDYPYSEHPSDLGEATNAVRMNLNAMAHYLKSHHNTARNAAITWAHLKLGNVTKPLTEERFQRKPEEYFLGLGKAVSSIADIDAAHSFEFPTNAIMVRRIAMLFAKYPDFASAFNKALNGNPTELKGLSDSVLSNLDGEPLPNLYRPSSTDMRADPSLLIRDCHLQ